ncbi:TonB family protein [Leptolyngbya sp. CCY15150]|uniref:TonB family protein n=1 Tax=Leptolyngbya sp. CCY15150 TaxID=2767772 RepID=UPI00194F46B3|nr:TonB family protein [Leptolyngbya sp. CCY15150]
MSLSQTAFQHRDRQSQLSNPILLWGVVGSMVAHGGLLPMFLWLGQQSPLPEPARIEIIVTEPPPLAEEEPEPAQLSDRPLEEAPVDEPSPQDPGVEAAPTASLLAPDATPEPVDSPPETVDDQVNEPVEEEPVEEDIVADQPDSPDEESPDSEAPDEVGEVDEPEPSASATEADSEPAEPRASTPRTHASRRSTQALGDRLQGRTPSNSRSQGSDRPGPPADTQAAQPGQTGSDNAGEDSADEDAGGDSRTVACQHCPSPRYPQSALDANVEGSVGIMVDISPSGAVSHASVVSSSGSSALDQAALSTVRGEWLFQPISGGANGVMVSVVMTISGSDLNRRAQEQGNRESVDLPSEPEPEESTAEVESEERQDQDDSAESTTEPLPESPPPSESPSEDSLPPEAPAVEPPEAISPPEEAPAEPPPADPVPDPPAAVEPPPPPEPAAPAPPVEVNPPSEIENEEETGL